MCGSRFHVSIKVGTKVDYIIVRGLAMTYGKNRRVQITPKYLNQSYGQKETLPKIAASKGGVGAGFLSSAKQWFKGSATILPSMVWFIGFIGVYLTPQQQPGSYQGGEMSQLFMHICMPQSCKPQN